MNLFPVVETFEGQEDSEVWDSFYAKVYDTLFYTKQRIEWELAQIDDKVLSKWPTTKTKVLDLGSGTGFHAAHFLNNGVPYIGIDESPHMVERARSKVPDAKFIVGDFTTPTTFSPESFSHILCMFFTVYSTDSKILFRNAYSWLKAGGYFVVHAVDPEKFDPILDAASPFPVFSLQKYSKKRITKSEVQFDGFLYKASFHKKPEEQDAYFEEIFEFTDESKKPRRHRHNMIMPPVEELITEAESMGFVLEEKIDMVPIQWEYQYLLIFRK